MISVDFKKEGEGVISLEICGHSTYKEGGQMIVCAAVSAIFYTLFGYLYNRYPNDIDVRRLERGHASISCRTSDTEAFRMACIGILQISESYPDQVSVKNGIWDSHILKKLPKRAAV